MRMDALAAPVMIDAASWAALLQLARDLGVLKFHHDGLAILDCCGDHNNQQTSLLINRFGS